MREVEHTTAAVSRRTSEQASRGTLWAVTAAPRWPLPRANPFGRQHSAEISGATPKSPPTTQILRCCCAHLACSQPLPPERCCALCCRNALSSPVDGINANVTVSLLCAVEGARGGEGRQEALLPEEGRPAQGRAGREVQGAFSGLLAMSFRRAVQALAHLEERTSPQRGCAHYQCVIMRFEQQRAQQARATLHVHLQYPVRRRVQPWFH